jgi:hypothetical protein
MQEICHVTGWAWHLPPSVRLLRAELEERSLLEGSELMVLVFAFCFSCSSSPRRSSSPPPARCSSPSRRSPPRPPPSPSSSRPIFAGDGAARLWCEGHGGLLPSRVGGCIGRRGTAGASQDWRVWSRLAVVASARSAGGEIRGGAAREE